MDPLDGLPLASEDEIHALGPVLVIAPHPDDETLGAGGLITLLRGRNVRVEIVLVSDGAGSHPNSRSVPPERLARLRRRELEAAMRILGLDPAHHLHALEYPDRAVPGRGAARHEEAIQRVREVAALLAPKTALLPWRRDPHADHRASFEIGEAALAGHGVRRLEYPIWLRVRAAPEDWPRAEELRGFRIDIARVVETKRRAVRAHASQTAPMIEDADETFCLTDDVLGRIVRRDEVFLETP